MEGGGASGAGFEEIAQAALEGVAGFFRGRGLGGLLVGGGGAGSGFAGCGGGSSSGGCRGGCGFVAAELFQEPVAQLLRGGTKGEALEVDADLRLVKCAGERDGDGEAGQVPERRAVVDDAEPAPRPAGGPVLRFRP